MKYKILFLVGLFTLILASPAYAQDDVNTTVSVDNNIPTVNFLDVPSTLTLTPMELDNDFNFTCQVSDFDGTSDIDLGSSRVYTEDADYSFDSLTVTQVNSTTLNVSGILDGVEYYQSPGDYSVNCEVNDNASSNELTENLTINTLVYGEVTESSLSYDSVYSGETSSTETFQVRNGGNVDLNSLWEGTDYTSGSDVLSVDNSKIVSSSLGGMTVLNSDKKYGVLEKQTDGGNSDRLYNPHFELFVPDGTPEGTYTNTYTHTVSQV